MATIEKRSDSYRCSIRKKGKNLSATFSDKETAEIWARYHEDLIDEMHNFDIPPEGLITLLQCIELKTQDLLSRKVDKKTIQEMEILKNEFKDIINTPLNQITYELIKSISQQMLGSMIRRGGNKKNNTGKVGLISPATVLRKLRCLSSVINFRFQREQIWLIPSKWS